MKEYKYIQVYNSRDFEKRINELSIIGYVVKKISVNPNSNYYCALMERDNSPSNRYSK